MMLRVALVCACVFGAASAAAEELAPEQARAFVVGKLFTYTCFDGTAGMGRIFADGSAVGTIQPPGERMARFAALPPGSIKVTAKSVCAHLAGLPIDPCFRVDKLNYRSFRGSILGLGFAYCDFHQHNPRIRLISSASQRGPLRLISSASQPAPAETAVAAKLRPSEE